MSVPVPSNPELLDELVRTAADDRLAVVARAGEPARVLSTLSDEAERSIANGIAQALERTDVVARLADAVGDREVRARAKRARARALSYAGRFDDALRLVGEILELAEGEGLPVEAAHARLVSMHALAEQGRFDEAIEAGTAAREAFSAAGLAALAGRCDANLGITCQRRDRPADAIRHFDRAAVSLAAEPIALAHIESNRGEALLALNDFGGAEHAFRRALAAFEDRGVRFASAVVMGNLADLAARQGRLHESLGRFERARRELESEAATGHLARLLAEQADAMSLLGLPEDAIATYQTALAALDGLGLALESARARTGYGLALLRVGRLGEAERELERAAHDCDRLGHAAAQARVHLIQAQLVAGRGRMSDAKALVDAAAAALADRPADAAIAAHHAARLAIATGELDVAEGLLQPALETASRFRLTPLHADLLHARSLVHRLRNRPELVIADLGEAVELIERVRGSLQAERLRAAFLADRLVAYEDLVRALLDRAGPDSVARAFAVAEQAKSRSLLDAVRGVLDVTDLAASDAADAGEAQLLARIAELRQELNALYSRLADEAEEEGIRLVRSPLPSVIRGHERELDELEARLSATRGAAALLARSIDCERAAAVVGRDAALVEYFAAGDELLAFVIVDGRAQVLRGVGDLAAVHATVGRLQFQINRTLRPDARRAGDAARGSRMLDDARRELGALHELVFERIARAVGDVGRIVIVPHGPLHLVPFHALWDGSRHLVQTREVSYAPSASVLASLRSSPSAGKPEMDRGRALVVGVADEAAPSIADEALAVAETLGCAASERLVGTSATVDAVDAAARDADLIHLACHGRFSIDDPRGSGLRLADRWLTVRDIYRMRLRASLVTLSGCETGRNLVRAGDELMGLLRAFLAAGAKSLLVSLWRVNDESALEFMARFYRAWRAPATANGESGKAAALRSAHLAMMERHPHPALWAPFALVGTR